MEMVRERHQPFMETVISNETVAVPSAVLGYADMLTLLLQFQAQG